MTEGFWASLGDLFLPDEDRYTYAEAIHRGDIMVSATVDAAHTKRAEDILEKYGTVNIDEREASWRKEGWSGYSGSPRAGAGVAASTRPARPQESLRPGRRGGNPSCRGEASDRQASGWWRPLEGTELPCLKPLSANK